MCFISGKSGIFEITYTQADDEHIISYSFLLLAGQQG